MIPYGPNVSIDLFSSVLSIKRRFFFVSEFEYFCVECLYFHSFLFIKLALLVYFQPLNCAGKKKKPSNVAAGEIKGTFLSSCFIITPCTGEWKSWSHHQRVAYHAYKIRESRRRMYPLIVEKNKRSFSSLFGNVVRKKIQEKKQTKNCISVPVSRTKKT